MTTARSLPCLAIAGPTACGKTAGALALAAVLARRGQPVEIISVDSALVYKGMDIGTAKPSAAELAAVPHHLIDIRDPLQAYSAAEFVADATRLIGEIRARGALPLLVGGTMLYFKALFDGIDEMPAANAEIRAQLEAEAIAIGWPAMHAELAKVDPITAKRLAPGDSQRIQRALEVWHISGQPLSHFHKAHTEAASSEAEQGLLIACPTASGEVEQVKCTLFSLEPTDRAWLHERVAQRFDAMLSAGLIEEVAALRAREDLHADLPSMRCVGYRQVWDEMDWQEAHQRTNTAAAASSTTEPHPDSAAALPLNMGMLREKGIAATRQLGKRQITWLRSMPQRHTIAADAPDAMAQLLQAALAQLAH